MQDCEEWARGGSPGNSRSRPGPGTGAVGPTILVVEDDLDIREALCMILEEGGYAARPAANGREALAAAAEGAPDAILLDLMMPVMSGWEFLRARHESPLLAAIPVIVVSASHSGPLPEVQAMLSKPIDLDALMAVLAQYCRH